VLGVHCDPFVGVGDLYQKLLESPVNWDQFQLGTPPIDHDGWFCTDPAKTAAEAESLPPGKVRDFLMSYICGQWADRSPDDALAYAKAHGLKPPYVRDEPAADQVRAALTSPDEALSAIFATEDVNSAASQQAFKLAETRASADPENTARWLVAQPETVSYDRQSAFYLKGLLDNTLGYYWARYDARGATEWLSEIPSEKRRTEAWLAMSHYTCEYNPDLAFTISAGLLNDGTRSGNLESEIKRAAERIGMPAARELLRNPDLSADERTSLSKLLDSMNNPTARP
jgi:hypothetical protein